MPIYEYECSECGVFEVTQRITENNLEECPVFKRSLQRLLSRTSFSLKGSGWYKTDYTNYNKKEKENGQEGIKSTTTKTKPEATTSASASSTDKAGTPTELGKD